MSEARMNAGIVVAGARWMSAKWWSGTSETAKERHDLAERAALSVETLRKARFVARVNGDPHDGDAEWTVLLRVEVYGTEETLRRARNHLRGFWAAIESRGCTPDYRSGFETGYRVLESVGAAKPDKLPSLQTLRRLKA